MVCVRLHNVSFDRGTFFMTLVWAGVLLSHQRFVTITSQPPTPSLTLTYTCKKIGALVHFILVVTQPWKQHHSRRSIYVILVFYIGEVVFLFKDQGLFSLSQFDATAVSEKLVMI